MSFYGNENADIPGIGEYKTISGPVMLYKMLENIWSAETCAPRMREKWTKDNKTMGQCSVTAFLAQDIFGGEVYGIARPDGNYHCYNYVRGKIFDLTSEQFGNEKLIYDLKNKQERSVHFQKKEKEERYNLLKRKLDACIKQ